MTGWACAHQQAFAMHGVHVIFLAATIAGSIAAGTLWRATTPSKTRSETLGRRHFLAGLATASGALSALVIAAMWIPNWVLSPCLA
jgi:3-methyladenine DNA glycosylase Mpg